MNLYKYHTNPNQLKHGSEYIEKVPSLAWAEYQNSKEELIKREHLWAKEPLYSFKYAFL